MKHYSLILLITPIITLAMDSNVATTQNSTTVDQQKQLVEVKQIMDQDIDKMMRECSSLDKLANPNAILSQKSTLDQTPKLADTLKARALEEAKKRQENAKAEAGTFKKKNNELKKRMDSRNRKLRCILCLLCPFTCGLSLIGCCCHKD